MLVTVLRKSKEAEGDKRARLDKEDEEMGEEAHGEEPKAEVENLQAIIAAMERAGLGANDPQLVEFKKRLAKAKADRIDSKPISTQHRYYENRIRRQEKAIELALSEAERAKRLAETAAKYHQELLAKHAGEVQVLKTLQAEEMALAVKVVPAMPAGPSSPMQDAQQAKLLQTVLQTMRGDCGGDAKLVESANYMYQCMQKIVDSGQKKEEVEHEEPTAAAQAGVPPAPAAPEPQAAAAGSNDAPEGAAEVSVPDDVPDDYDDGMFEEMFDAFEAGTGETKADRKAQLQAHFKRMREEHKNFSKDSRKAKKVISKP